MHWARLKVSETVEARASPGSGLFLEMDLVKMEYFVANALSVSVLPKDVN